MINECLKEVGQSFAFYTFYYVSRIVRVGEYKRNIDIYVYMYVFVQAYQIRKVFIH